MPYDRTPSGKVRIKIPWDEWNRLTDPKNHRISDEIERRWMRDYLRKHPERDLRNRTSTRADEPMVSDEIERRWLRDYLRRHPERDLRKRPE